MDESRLFAGVREEVYDRLFEELQELRKLHPAYCDDQLLMRMLCDREQTEAVD